MWRRCPRWNKGSFSPPRRPGTAIWCSWCWSVGRKPRPTLLSCLQRRASRQSCWTERSGKIFFLYLPFLSQGTSDCPNVNPVPFLFINCSLKLNIFRKFGIACSSLHSMKPQRERLSSLSQFKSNQTKVLIATDVASRGLDIPEVDLVVNHNVPKSPTVSKRFDNIPVIDCG